MPSLGQAAAFAALLLLAFSPWRQPWAAWLALVPWALLAIDARDWKGALAGGFIAGLLFYLPFLDFIRTAANAGGGLSRAGPFAAVWLIVASAASVQLALQSLILRTLVHWSSWPLCFGIPLVWTGGEALRDVVLRSSSGTTACMSSLGVSQASWPVLIQTADVGSTYLVTWLVATLNGLIADVVLARRRRCASACVSLACTIGVGQLIAAAAYSGWVYSRSSDDRADLRVAIVPRMFESSVSDFKDLSESSARGFDLAVWPEAAVVGHVHAGNHPLRQRLAGAAADLGTPLLIGCTRGAQSSDLDGDGREDPGGTFLLGAFGRESSRVSLFHDGLDNTILVSEVRKGVRLDVRGAHLAAIPGGSHYMCRFTPNGFRDEYGIVADGAGDQIPFGPMCDPESGIPCQYDSRRTTSFAGARSWHSGGVHVLRGSGGVRLASDLIDHDVWIALHSRSGKESGPLE